MQVQVDKNAPIVWEVRKNVYIENLLINQRSASKQASKHWQRWLRLRRCKLHPPLIILSLTNFLFLSLSVCPIIIDTNDQRFFFPANNFIIIWSHHCCCWWCSRLSRVCSAQTNDSLNRKNSITKFVPARGVHQFKKLAFLWVTILVVYYACIQVTHF